MTLECRRLGKVFPTRSGPIRALEDLSFRIEDEELLCVVGPNGCGKTTLLKLLAGLLRPTSGEIRFDGGTPPHAAMVFQEDGLFPWKSLLENVAFGLGRLGLPRRERLDRARAFLDQVGLGRFARNYPHELSVGMRQRANVARAFVSEPEILLMDEPFASLDAQTRLLLQEELLRIWKEHRRSVVYVTHDFREAVLLGDRVLVLSGRPGRVREEIPVPLPRPRGLTGPDHPEVTRIAEHLWRILENEVRGAI